MKSLHVITGLSTGGAEMMLYKVLKGIKKYDHKAEVVSLGVGGRIAESIENIPVKVYFLGMLRARIPSIKSIQKLKNYVLHSSADIIQGWMYHGNLAASLSAWFLQRNIPVVWNVRQTIYDLSNEKRLTRWIIRANAFFSSHADVVIFNSQISANQHEKLGFDKSRMLVIPNGFDTDVFRPSEEDHREFRKEFGLEPDSIVVGHVGRFHPMKDHIGFIQAAALVVQDFPDTYFVMVGNGVDKKNHVLMERISKFGLEERIFLLGERDDTPVVTAAFDIAVSSSAWGEGFPNVVGEAMCCSVPCVVTDVGDSSIVVANTGLVVPPQNYTKLGAGIKHLIQNPLLRKELGQKARERIVKNYSLDSVVLQYLNLYSMLIKKKHS